MIAYLQGNITNKSLTNIIVEVGGVGYELHISLYTYEMLKDMSVCKIYTYVHITQDAHTMYGFIHIEEKQWFLNLTGVNGIGPRVAMTILSSLTPTDIQHAILAHNTIAFQAIKGIGQKVAQRIILELQGKVGKADVDLPTNITNHGAIYQEALIALSRLGMTKSTVEKTLTDILKNYTGDITTETLIKLVLKGG